MFENLLALVDRLKRFAEHLSDLGLLAEAEEAEQSAADALSEALQLTRSIDAEPGNPQDAVALGFRRAA